MKKKLKGDPWEILTKIPKKKIKMRFLNNVTVPKNVKGHPLGFFNIILLQNIETNEGALWCNPKIEKKSQNAEKNSQRGILLRELCFRGSGRRFCFFFVLDEVLRFRVL